MSFSRDFFSGSMLNFRGVCVSHLRPHGPVHLDKRSLIATGCFIHLGLKVGKVCEVHVPCTINITKNELLEQNQPSFFETPGKVRDLSNKLSPPPKKGTCIIRQSLTKLDNYGLLMGGWSWCFLQMHCCWLSISRNVYSVNRLKKMEQSTSPK